MAERLREAGVLLAQYRVKKSWLKITIFAL